MSRIFMVSKHKRKALIRLHTDHTAQKCAGWSEFFRYHLLAVFLRVMAQTSNLTTYCLNIIDVMQAVLPKLFHKVQVEC